MKAYEKIIQDLENELKRTTAISDKLMEQMEFAMGHCRIALINLREMVRTRGFADIPSEIRFFKEIKPAAYSQFLFYKAVFDLESNRFDSDLENIRGYYQDRLEAIKSYMLKNHVKVQYHRYKYAHLDEQFFVRGRPDIPLVLRDSPQLLDEVFFTWRDHAFSKIMANERLIEYIQNQLKKLDGHETTVVEFDDSIMEWTAQKIDLVEIIYSLYFAKSVNGGKITIRKLTEGLGGLFNVDLSKDVYRFHTELIQRMPENRTTWINYELF